MTDFEFQLDNFMLYCTSRNLAKKTLASYEQSLKLFGLYLQDTFQIEDARKVQSGHIRQYIRYLQERGKYSVVVNQSTKNKNYPEKRTDYGQQISTTTIANYVRNLKVFFNWLHGVEREITKNPCETIENPKIHRKAKKTLTPEDISKVLKQFDVSKFHDYRNAIIVKLILDTGMRIGECLSLTPEHLDLNHKSILLTDTKNKHQRYVYFSSKMSADLKAWLRYRDRYITSAYLFPTTRGTQLEVRNFEKALRDAGKRAGVEIHPHQLRNNFAKYYILNGGDWFSLCKLLGHSSVEVTQQAYMDLTDQDIYRQHAKFSPLAHMDI
ncbi:hypothetical protein PACILC2_44580 [Paenibacillus cisolokensis]|uniref:Integrase n=1 Tax=Paenibacillus cisolokensis TaxID=1658519 RepID=A0ABQ4NCI2_9BACL|nr:tyrosine-type recombinase/integrase [Paenibacillus cisolokensis]GIQ65890.1 hypothetical protein PACILC2_44580 [Paenibacillus cisolokensis]